jgi:hypothetical protein
MELAERCRGSIRLHDESNATTATAFIGGLRVRSTAKGETEARG